jgi:hypothetical protein
MNDDLYNQWIERAAAEPPADFADRVMDAVRVMDAGRAMDPVRVIDTAHREPPPSSRGVLVRLLSSPGVRVAACVLACLAWLYRLAAVVAVFFVQ